MNRLFGRASLAVAFLFVASCGLKDEVAQSGGGSGGPDFNGQRLRKTGEALFQAFSDVTGVPTNQTNFLQEYEGVKFALPIDTNPEATTVSMYTATLSLAARACDRLWIFESDPANAAARRHYKNVPFASAPTAFTAAQREEAMRSLILAAWHREATAGEIQTILTRLQEVQTAGANNSATTRTMCLVGCTAILSSYDALKL